MSATWLCFGVVWTPIQGPHSEPIDSQADQPVEGLVGRRIKDVEGVERREPLRLALGLWRQSPLACPSHYPGTQTYARVVCREGLDQTIGNSELFIRSSVFGPADKNDG